MKKIISFSLFGSDPKYTIGILCNVELSSIIYPNWICRVYYGKSVPSDIIQKLSSYKNVELVYMEENDNISYMTWRFLPIDDEDVYVMLSRDADSRLSFREKYLVDLFLESDYMFHDIRDHYLHSHTMGGTWGIKKGAIPSMKELLHKSIHTGKGLSYGSDQDFMLFDIFPYVRNISLIHSSHNNIDFPIKQDTILSNLISPVHKNHNHFIGEVFPGNNYNKPYNHIFY